MEAQQLAPKHGALGEKPSNRFFSEAAVFWGS
jgi:hypothetical protein